MFEMRRPEFMAMLAGATVEWPTRLARAAAGDAGDRVSQSRIA
jgi:hypothetical protein